MGSSGSTNYKQPKTPAPPSDMIAGAGQTAGFKPSYINFLGDTNVPSTGLTPEMIAAIDATNGAGRPPGGGMGGSSGMGMPGGDLRSQFADLMAQYERDKWEKTAFGGALNFKKTGQLPRGGFRGSGR